jgi:hypothetical protein
MKQNDKFQTMNFSMPGASNTSIPDPHGASKGKAFADRSSAVCRSLGGVDWGRGRIREPRPQAAHPGSAC